MRTNLPCLCKALPRDEQTANLTLNSHGEISSDSRHQLNLETRRSRGKARVDVNQSTPSGSGRQLLWIYVVGLSSERIETGFDAVPSDAS